MKSSYNAYSQSGSGSGAGAMQMRGYASDKERQELYSDEAGGIGAGVSVFSTMKSFVTQNLD